MKILLIEDESKITDFVTTGFQDAGLQIDSCTEGLAGLQMVLTNFYDAIVLDLMLPGLDGLAILRRLRGSGITTPVILLTAKTELPDRITGFDAGADDYLPKPFFIEELIVRVRTLVARRNGQIATVIQHCGLSLDRVSRRASWAGSQVVLSQREFTLIEYLMRSPGHIFSRSQILKHVWGLDFDPKTNVVDVCVQRLRKKLMPAHGAELKDFPIEPVRGIGYRFREG